MHLKKAYLFLLPLALLLTACGDELTIRNICDKYPELCDDLNQDGWCRYEKANLIRDRYVAQRSPSDETRYELMLTLEIYRDCIGLASQIQHKNRKERTSSRTEGYIASMAQLETLVAETKESDYPPLLYFHWSREGEYEALRKLLVMDKAGKLETAEMQFNLASYYSKRSPELTVKKLYHALSLLNPGEEADRESFSTLATLFYGLNDYPHSYLWTRIAELAGDQHADSRNATKRFKLSEEMVERLDLRAKDYLDAIESATFSAAPPAIG